MTVRIGSVWDETWRFARAEAALWLPIAFAFWGLPALVPSGNGGDLASGSVDPLAALTFLLSGLWQLFGQLTLAGLVLRPGGSVAEALAAAGRRYLGALGTALLLGVVATAYLAATFAVAMVTGLVTVTPAGVPAADAGGRLVVAIIVLPLLFAAVRLCTLWPGIVARGRGGWPAIRLTFGETRTVIWRLLLLLLVYTVALLIVLSAVATGLGTLARLVALTSGAGGIASALVLLVEAAISAAASGLLALFVAHLHRRLAVDGASAVPE